MPQGKGTFGNQVGRPKGLYSAQESTETSDYGKQLEFLQGGGHITEIEAQKMREQQAYQRQVDQEMQQRKALAEGLRNYERLKGGGHITEYEALQMKKNLGNPTSRDFADPEIDEALRKQRLFYK
tara:strand:+ start:56 stop:430 length:375 start_codon:yes stop_codon:yes gene_type:complete